MKSFALSMCALLCSFGVRAADSTSIYHTNAISSQQDWIDSDKNGRKDIFEDSSRPIAKRVENLLSKMTIDEKIGQLQLITYGANPTKDLDERLKNGEIGALMDGSTLIEQVALRNKLQHIAIEQSRLGIPLIFAHDSIHGFRTVFPIPLAQSCAWEPDLFERTQTISARESAAAGIDWVFAPMVDLARDPRWGRIAEGFGEDPWLGALDAAASVRGFQGTNYADTNRVVACLKHFVGYGAPEGGRDYNTTEISDFTLRNFYLPQFKAGVDAGALTLMSAFNELSGIPASANRHTLGEILRGEWKFSGLVVSDWESVLELIDHGLAADKSDAARLGLTAGVDMEMVSTTYHDTLKQQIEQGKISKKILDDAVRRVLMLKFEKGLFDRPFTDESRSKTAFLQDDAIALAREAAAKSCVLLKNQNNILPLSPQLKKMALIGPFAEDGEEMVGTWYSRAHTNDIVSLADAVRTKLPFDFQLVVARGCSIIEPDSGKIRRHIGDFTPIKERPTETNEIAQAVEAAKSADLIVLTLGEPRDWSDESASRTELNLPGRQMELFDAIVATGKPVIVVLFNGRPLAIPAIQKKAAAILEAWFPGVQGGNGVADVLFGDVNPSGRLTTTFLYSVGQVPFYYNHSNTGRPGFGDFKGNYADAPTTPLYPFGFGLSYTTFEFSKVRLKSPQIQIDGNLIASIEVTNTGAKTGSTVVELYIRDLASSVGPRPVRELKGFKKIELEPGQSQQAQFEIPAHDLGCYDSKGNWVLEPGKFQLWISKDSTSGEPIDFEILK